MLTSYVIKRAATIFLLAPFLIGVVGAYDFSVTSEGGFYSSIDNTTGVQIGERFQNNAISPEGKMIGISQGFAFNFSPDTSPDPANRNWIFFLEGGQLDVLDQAIVSGTGKYEKYTGGTVQQQITSVDPTYTSEITLVEPQQIALEEESNNELETQFQFGFEGGYVQLIYDTSGEQIGTLFQVDMLVKNVSSGDFNVVGGLNQGYALNFPNAGEDPYIEKYQPANSSTEVVLTNRLFFIEGGNVLTTLDNTIIQGTGAYSKYTGGSFSLDIISPDPDFLGEINLKEKKDPVNVDKSNLVPISFTHNKEEGFSSIIQDSAGDKIGARFRHPVYDGDDTRIGTILGYVIEFPEMSNFQNNRNGNKNLYLEEGQLTLFNDVVVWGSGVYEGYIGTRVEMSHKPNTTIVEIRINPPQEAADVGTTETSGSIKLASRATIFLLLMTISFLMF